MNTQTKKKIYVVNGGMYYASWLIPLGFKLTNNRDEADLVFFTGGSDVTPAFYGEKEGAYVSCDPERDTEEAKEFAFFRQKHVPMIGVCRGGQFLTAMNGGKMCQHMSHPSRHETIMFDGKRLESTSTHHNQFIIDPKVTGLKEKEDFELLGWAENLSPFHLNGEDKDYNFPKDYKEPEIVFYPKSNALSIQMHPEFFDLEHETVKYLQKLFMHKLFA